MSLRILIAEDSTLFADILVDLLSQEPGVEIVALVDNGVDAVALCQEHSPDIVLMDINMPRMDGLSATEEIMARSPTPILVITSDPHRGGVDLSFRALSAGALDLIAKPTQLPFPPTERDRLLRKIRLLSQIPVVRHVRGRRRPDHPTVPIARHRPAQSHTLPPPCLIGVVASTGGPRALARICTNLPHDFAGSLLIVQHITDGFSHHLARWLDKHCPLSVIEADAGAPILPAHAYIAPTGRHLIVDAQQRLAIDDAPPIGGHRPSGDRLLMSLARHAPSRSIGLVLSGMGSDGTAGLTALYQSGSPTLAQDEASSVVFGMPHSAISSGVVGRVLSDAQIAPHLVRIVDEMNHPAGDRA